MRETHNVPEPEQYDIIVVGAGPAGCTVARLLALRGRRVLLITGPRRRSLVEILPPSSASILERLGIRGEVDGLRPLGRATTFWCGEASVADGENSGWVVVRDRFDAFLLEQARNAGVALARNSRAPKFDVNAGEIEFDGGFARARFIVGATGRSGFMARQLVRYWDPRYKTLALCALWRGSVSMTSHSTFVESYPDGWLSSAPGDSDAQYVYAMVDSDAVRQDPEQAYRAAIANTSAFRDMLQHATLAGAVWPEDASPYRAQIFAQKRWLLAGDSGCFADPLTWAGLERALESAFTAAAVVDACLRQPDSAEIYARYYDESERRTYADHIRRASERYAAAAARYSGSFWRDRRYPPPELALASLDDLQTGIDALNKSTGIRLRRPEALEFEQRPVLRGDVLAIATVPTLSGLPPERQQFEGVSLPDLAALARENHTVAALTQAYNRTQSPVAERQVRQAIAVLAALGVLVCNS